MANLRANNLTGTGGRNAIDGSVFFDGESSYLSMASGAMISGTGFGTNDFTIEFWMNQGVNAGDYTGIFNCKSSSTTHRFQVAFKDSKIHVYTDTSTWRDTGYAPTAGVFEHIAFQRDYSGNTLKMYANGEEKWSVSNTRDYNEVFDYVYIGDHGTAYDNYQGYLSNLRVCTHLVYASNYFTPPTQKLGLHPETILLCCQDSDDPTQEATGKTITGVGGLDITQAEKINGRFNQDPTGNGWTLHSGASGSYANGQWTVTSPATIWKGAFTSFTSVIGQQYRLTGIVVTSNNWGSISVSNDGGAAKIVYPGWNASTSFPLTINVIFTATATTTYVSIDNLNTTNTTATTVQYVSVKPVEVGKVPKFLPPVGIDEGVTFEGDTKVNSPGVMYFPTGDTTQRGRGRGFYMVGYASPAGEVNSIDYLNIQSMGNTIKFGDLLSTKYAMGAGASSTRGIFCGGYDGSSSPDTDINQIDYITIATTGNAIDFGDRTVVGRSVAAASSSTRVVMAAGQVGNPGIINTIDYITTATLGNAADFGDLLGLTNDMCNACNSPTRGIFNGGNTPGSPYTQDVMQYVTLASAGNATDFGNLTAAARGSYGGTASSNTRGLICLANQNPNNNRNEINYVTIATTGNAVDFGDLFTGRYAAGSCSNSLRAVFLGGRTPSYINTMDTVMITTTGNATDFGDTSVTSAMGSAGSDSHGGLS